MATSTSSTFTFPEGSLTLNAEQARIVRQPAAQSLRILASAGSGKTTTLTARIAHLLTTHGAQPREIVLLTFTHNAAAVMRTRLEALVGNQRIWCGTFHSLSQAILREHQPEALDDIYHVDELPLKALDFFRTPAGHTWAASIRWIFIDEFQDINDVQYNFIRAIHTPAAAMTIVGDDAQNIYSWRGSCVDYILNFHQRFANVADFQLSTNYRSTAAIVAVANSIMRRIPTLPHKELMTASPAADHGSRPEVHYFARTSEEREWVSEAAAAAVAAGSSAAILSKFNSVLYAYEAALLKLGARVRFIHGEEPATTAAGTPPTVYLATFHGSKGLEWEHVFLVRMNDEVFPQQKDADGILQERRLFYVAATRARRTLIISYSRNERSLSRFVREVHRPLLVFRGIPRYELSDLTSAVKPTRVADWISHLTGEDYRAIKSVGILPASLLSIGLHEEAANARDPRTQWITPYWWAEQGMSAEFYDFLRTFWLREVGLAHPESGGLWDRQAQELVWTIKIAAEDAALFETHRPMFERLAHRFFGKTTPGDAPPQVYYTDIIGAMGSDIVAGLDQADIIRVIQIIHKMRTMLYNLRFAGVQLADLRFAPIRHSPPQESRCQLIEAWRFYTSGARLAAEELIREDLGAIYLIGLCRSLGEGRSGVLAALPGEREWSRCRPFLREFRRRIAATLEEAKGQSVLARVAVEVADGIVGEADMVIGGTAWFFVGGEQAGELHQLDRMVGVLLTVHGLRAAGIPVERVRLFQLLTGNTVEWSVGEWSPTASALLTAFVQARVGHAVAERG
jgi:hypothetical protein